MNLLMAILFCEFQTPQQRLLRAGGQRGGGRDERLGRLLRHARGPDVNHDTAVVADGDNGAIAGGRREPAAEGRRRRGRHGCSDIGSRERGGQNGHCSSDSFVITFLFLFVFR